MKFWGNPSGSFWGYEAKQTIAWLAPIVLTAATTYGMSWIEALRTQGGWRAVLATVLVFVGRGVYLWLSNNTKLRT